jgi:hypothetical protein
VQEVHHFHTPEPIGAGEHEHDREVGIPQLVLHGE